MHHPIGCIRLMFLSNRIHRLLLLCSLCRCESVILIISSIE